ncbi:MAG: hypothetical protein NW224_00110 [Leptolyngbyaceae cyanobacterium bins.302]|nr:hypothetical protein [Leptolyngbyaceae cyanobacterium bins.302]
MYQYSSKLKAALAAAAISLCSSGIALAAPKPYLHTGLTCLEVGYMGDQLSCIYVGGHTVPKVGSGFYENEAVYIYLRLRELPPGKHTIRASYHRREFGANQYSLAKTQKVTFSNTSPGWIKTFQAPAEARTPGNYIIKLHLDNQVFLGEIRYCVSQTCFLEG